MSYPLITFTTLALKDLFGKTYPLQDKREHLLAAVKWLEQAHNMSERSGVSYGYSVSGGWRPPYRETTGYIAVTFFNLANFLEDSSFRKRAEQMSEWLLTIQNEDGSVSNPNFEPENGIVFDTGQVLFGLVRAYEETNDKRFLNAAINAGDWLYNSAADDRLSWTKYTYKGIPHVYNARVAWSVLRLNQINPEEKWVNLARANIDFAFEQNRNGWFDQCAFDSDASPFTHTIAYAIRGVYESSQLLNDKNYQSVAENVAQSSTRKVSSDGFVPGQIDINGQPTNTYCCLTGNCQLAIVWAKMYKVTGNTDYKTSAINALKYVMQRQVMDTNTHISGAIKGSYPIWGKYSRFTFPNWATKFYIDALIECWDWL